MSESVIYKILEDIMSKYLKVPETVVLKNLVTDEHLLVQNPNDLDNPSEIKILFYTFVVGTLLKDPAFGSNAITVMHAIDIKDKLKDAPEGSYVEVDDEAADLLMQVIKQPANPFNPEIAVQLGPFLKSILDASDKKPDETPAEKPVEKVAEAVAD